MAAQPDYGSRAERSLRCMKSTPSWFIYGDRDLNIPPAALSFMANRANSKETVVVNGASHVVMVSHSDAIANLIDRAATAP